MQDGLTRLLRIGTASLCPLVLLTACGSASRVPDRTVVPTALLQECLTLPEAQPPKTNGELAEGFLTAREGHTTCRSVVQTVSDYFGEENEH